LAFFKKTNDLKNNGGEEGIRTLDTLLTYTPLAGERLRPLGHLSGAAVILVFGLVIKMFFGCDGIFARPAQ
jgi:hypothetical protein